MSLDFNHPTKSLLEQEQGFINQGYTEDDLNRQYPGLPGGSTHPDICCCSECDPDSYIDHCGQCGKLWCTCTTYTELEGTQAHMKDTWKVTVVEVTHEPDDLEDFPF